MLPHQKSDLYLELLESEVRRLRKKISTLRDELAAEKERKDPFAEARKQITDNMQRDMLGIPRGLDAIADDAPIQVHMTGKSYKEFKEWDSKRHAKS